MESTHFRSNLFIVADDLGLDSAVNEGIFFAFKNGLISGASLMANGDAFGDAINGLKDFPDAGIGAHLVLVEEKSLTGIKFPQNHKIFFLKYVLGLIKRDNIEKELEAQINKILELGIKPEFINSHQHLHLLPGIMDMVILLAKKYNIGYIRIVSEPFKIGTNLPRRIQSIFLRILSSLAKRKIRKAGIKFNDFFVGFIDAGNLSVRDLESANKIKNLYPEKIVELGCHPGFESQKLVEKYGYWRYNWEKEIEVLKKND